MKKTWLAVAFLLSLAIAGCGKIEEEPFPGIDIVYFSATLNGASEETATGSSGTGWAGGLFDNTSKTLSGTINYTGITPVAGHIHVGPLKTSGPIVFTFTPSTSPINFEFVLTAAQEKDLFADKYYINLHTTAFPEGEIRGQIITQ
ncbi:MAG: CHRD domain-containing protein [Bacteroidota bacterium]